MNRREMLLKTGASVVALGLARFPLGWSAPADAPKRRILMYTRSEGFEHDVVRRGKDGKLSLAETIVTDLGAKHGFEVKCEKDGRVFVNDDLGKYDAFLFETQGDLGKEQSRDGQPPVPPEGKKALLQAVRQWQGLRRLPLRQRHLPHARRPRRQPGTRQTRPLYRPARRRVHPPRRPAEVLDARRRCRIPGGQGPQGLRAP
jgi:hypothetical protein